jgi:hypothetical protein
MTEVRVGVDEIQARPRTAWRKRSHRMCLFPYKQQRQRSSLDLGNAHLDSCQHQQPRQNTLHAPFSRRDTHLNAAEQAPTCARHPKPHPARHRPNLGSSHVVDESWRAATNAMPHPSPKPLATHNGHKNRWATLLARAPRRSARWARPPCPPLRALRPRAPRRPRRTPRRASPSREHPGCASRSMPARGAGASRGPRAR